VTVRKRPDTAPDGDREILCVAPSPDWATALAMAQQLSGSGSVTGGPSASLTASNSLTETISALAGRTAGVVALRDGLYRACEAYANGVIGKDGYALILSQYGDLLTALAGTSTGGGGGGGGSSTPSSSSTPSGVAVSVSTGATPRTAPKASSSDSSSASSQTGSAAPTQLQLGILQAMVVACISENDPTVPRGRDSAGHPLANQLLTADKCGNLLAVIAAAAPDLLKPVTANTSNGTGKSQAPPPMNTKASCVSDPAVKAFQDALNDAGERLMPDGCMGPLTKAAAARHKEIAAPKS
jgi:hypothetical protein